MFCIITGYFHIVFNNPAVIPDHCFLIERNILRLFRTIYRDEMTSSGMIQSIERPTIYFRHAHDLCDMIIMGITSAKNSTR